MSNDFPSIIKSFVIVSLFSFLIIGFAVSLAQNYNKDTGDYESALGLSGFNDSLNVIDTKTGGWMTSFTGQSIFNPLSVAGIVVTTTFNLLTGMFQFILMPFKLISSIATNVLKIPSIIINIIWVLITLTAIFGIWRLIRSGY